ncbi:MAG: hypothetical protein RL518_421 [Pseudomonadota bacterium]|jgi:hypothetical protein
MLKQSSPQPVTLNAPSGLGISRTTFEIQDLKLGVQMASLSFEDGQQGHVTAHFPDLPITTPLVAPDRGTFITAFMHDKQPFLVRFADFEERIVVLPAHDEAAGFSKPEQRFYVQTVPTHLDHMLLTPFANTGLSRFLTRLAVENALASTGHATAHVRLAKMQKVLEDCGLTQTFRRPHHHHEREASKQDERDMVALGYRYDLEGAGWLDDVVVLGRSASRAEREQNKHWNLATTFRIFESRDGRYFEHRIPRRES